MSNETKSLSVAELIAVLNKYPQDAQVFISRDEEGNGYGTLADTAIEHGTLDNVIVLYPVIEGLDYDVVFPKEWEQESEEDKEI